MPGQIVNFVRLHFEKDLEYAPEIIERNGGQLNIPSDTESFQIVKGGDLRVAGSATNVVPILQQQFCQISAILP